jgi:hypothetical protein
MNPMSLSDGTFIVENLITVQKNENIPINVTVPTTLCFPLHDLLYCCPLTFGLLPIDWLKSIMLTPTPNYCLWECHF